MVYWKVGSSMLLWMMLYTLHHLRLAPIVAAFAPATLRNYRRMDLYESSDPNNGGDGGMDATARAFLAYQVAPVAPPSPQSDVPTSEIPDMKLEREMETQYAGIEAIDPRRIEESAWDPYQQEQGYDVPIEKERDGTVDQDIAPPVRSSFSNTTTDGLVEQQSSFDLMDDSRIKDEPYAYPEQAFEDVATMDAFAPPQGDTLDTEEMVQQERMDPPYDMDAGMGHQQELMEDDVGLDRNEGAASERIAQSAGREQTVMEEQRGSMRSEDELTVAPVLSTPYESVEQDSMIQTGIREEADSGGQSVLMRSAEKLGLVSESDVKGAKVPSIVPPSTFRDETVRSDLATEQAAIVNASVPSSSKRDSTGGFDAPTTTVSPTGSSIPSPVESMEMARGPDSDRPVAPSARTEAVVTKVTSLDTSNANSVVATTRAKQRIKEDEEKPNLLLQILGDIVFSSGDDGTKEKPARKEIRTPAFEDLTEKLKSSMEEEATAAEPPEAVAAPPETYYFNVNAQQGKWNPNEEDSVFRNESPQRPWTASLDSRGNFCVTYFDDDTVPVAPKRTGKGTDEWDQYENGSGRVYFVNRETGESQWDIPPGFELVETPSLSSILGEDDPSNEQPVPDLNNSERVVVESKNEAVEKVETTKDEEAPLLTPIQRLLGKMSPAERAELSVEPTRTAPENFIEPQNMQPDNELPSPIQRLLGQMQGTDEKMFVEQSTAPAEVQKKKDSDKGLTPIQRLLKNNQLEQDEEPQPPKKSEQKSFWSLNRKDDSGEEEAKSTKDVPESPWPFWKK